LHKKQPDKGDDSCASAAGVGAAEASPDSVTGSVIGGDSFAEIPDIEYTPEIPFTPPDNPAPPVTTTATYNGSVGNGEGKFSFDLDIQNRAIENARTSGVVDRSSLAIGNANIIAGEFQLGFYDENVSGSTERINMPIEGER
jgi:hypothetical protein